MHIVISYLEEEAMTFELKSPNLLTCSYKRITTLLQTPLNKRGRQGKTGEINPKLEQKVTNGERNRITGIKSFR
ncbi:hypothetical protein C1H46_042314 [Malus baccata]|uniref:Uncharacterized protein n=1 Tax=Malus baccata TaxID=106549 RepID=A0A540KDF4_MALBA|nr:hypothetical protein C1H46_042314 [Malus baccata]